MDIKTLWEKYYSALKQQEWSKAHVALSAIKEIKKEDSQVHLKSGDLLQRMGDTAGAIEAYHKAAIYLIKEGFMQKAAAIFKIILRLDPKNHEASMKLQRVVEVASSSKGAFAHFTPSKGMEVPPAADAAQPYVGRDTRMPYPPEVAGPDETGIDEKEAPSYTEVVSPVDLPEARPEVPLSYGEITLPGAEEGAAGLTGDTIELGPGYGEITLDEGAEEGETGQLPDGEINVPGYEESVAGLTENTGQPDPGYGEITPDEAEAKGVQGAAQSDEQTIPEDFEGFDDLLAEAAKGLPSMEEGPRLSTDLPSVFMPIGQEQASELAGRAEKKFYLPGERIIREGDTGDSLFYLLKGSVKVVAHILGKEFVLTTLGEGDLFGEVTFLTGRPRTASVVADGNIEVLEFNRELLEDAISKNPEVLACLNDLYDARVSNTLKRMGSE